MRKCVVWSFGAVALGVMMLGAGGSSDGGYEYVGTKTCKKCHYDIWESWAKTKMAGSFHVLKPDAALKPSKKTGLTAEWIAEIKASKDKAEPKIDHAKDYSRDADCIKCHVTGYGEAGGYAIPRRSRRNSGPTRAKSFFAAGMTKISAETCNTCHTKESPLVGDDYVFDFEKKKDEGTHKHIEMKLRKE